MSPGRRVRHGTSPRPYPRNGLIFRKCKNAHPSHEGRMGVVLKRRDQLSKAPASTRRFSVSAQPCSGLAAFRASISVRTFAP